VPGDADIVDRMVATALAQPPGQAPEAMRATIVAALDLLEAADASRRPLVVAVLPMLAMFAQQPERAERLFAAAARHEDPWIRASVPMARAQIAENDGDVDATRVHLAAALDGFRAVGDRWALALALTSWGALRTVDGALDEAADALEEARAQLAELDAGFAEALLLMRLGDVRLRQGNLAAARALLDRAARSPGATRGEQRAIIMAASARVAGLAGDGARARALAAQALETIDAVPGDRAARGHGDAMVHAVAAALAVDDDLAAAAGHLRAAYAAAVPTRDMPVLAAVGVGLAQALHAAGEPAAAAEVLGAAARVRGADDVTAVDVARLRAALCDELGAAPFAAAYDRGRGLDRDAAQARLDPAVLRAVSR
jgi:hypothetical protein